MVSAGKVIDRREGEASLAMLAISLPIRICSYLDAKTRVQNLSSTRFYLNDKPAGKPRATKLPYLVHGIEKVAAVLGGS